MFPSVLVTALIALGSGCIIISISIFHYFRDRVSSHVRDNMVRTFSSKETIAFLEAIKEGKVSSIMLKDFFNQLSTIWKPQQWLKNLWVYFPTSGVFFIIVGLLGSFANYENLIFDCAIYTLLLIAIAFFILGTWQLTKLARKLMS